MVRELGGVFGIAIAVAVFAGAGRYTTPAEFVDGFAPAITVAAGLALLGAVIHCAAGSASGDRRRGRFVSFVHVAVTDGEADASLPQLDAFRAFVADLCERCEVPAQATRAGVVGAYPQLAPDATHAGSSAA